MTGTRASFKPDTKTGFGADLHLMKDRVLHGTKVTGNSELYTKAIIIGAGWIFFYLSLVLFPLQPDSTISLLVHILKCICLGFFTAMIGFNIMHDGGHGSFSSKSWVNTIMVSTLNVLGGNHVIWKFKHNTVHHTFTNVADHDDDIELGVLARFHPAQKWYWFHRLQAIYVPLFLYPLGYISWIYIHDFKKYFTGKVGSAEFTLTPSQHVVFWISKLTHVALFVVLPLVTYSLTQVLIGYAIVTVTTGFLISIVFQLAHVVPQAQMIAVNEHNAIVDEFPIHQIKTTADFATKSKFWKWFCGGLNFQVVHHLFPKVSHVHYPKLQIGVKELCKKYNIPYNENDTFLSAVIGHLKTLWYFGKKSTVIA